jgi:hypothetical protein
MAGQRAGFQIFRPNTAVALAGIGLVMLLGKLDGPAAEFMDSLHDAFLKEVLELVSSLVPAASEAFRAYAFYHLGFSGCPLNVLVSFWALLHVIAG